MGKRIDVTPDFCILWALLLLVLPLPLLVAAMAAALIHELCHILAIRLLGGELLGLTVGAGGMVLETLPQPPGKELLCALAGPMGSLLLILLQEALPLLALCGFVQGCFNLLPLYPMDGGRAVFCVLQMTGRENWMGAIEMITLLLLLIAAVGAGWGAVAAWGIIAVRKIPCKASRFGVQ